MVGTVEDARWRDVPGLAWVLGCAYGAGPAWLRRVGAPVLGLAMGVPAVVAGRRQGRVLHLGRRALVLVEEPRSGWRRAAAMAEGAAVAIPALMVLAVVLAVATAPLPTRLGVLVTLAVLVAPLAPVVWSVTVRSRRQVLGVAAARRAGLVPADAALVAMLAAWPRHRGHGGRLLRGLDGVLADYPHPVVAAARSRELADWYGVVAGLVPVEPGSLVLVRKTP